MPPTLTIVIPTLNAARHLGATLAAVAETAAVAGTPAASPASDVVVADGGSTDATVAIAHQAGARVIRERAGRGAQLAAGAAAAGGDWLLFLHADTVPAPGWAQAVGAFMADPANRERAATFRYRLDDTAPRARRLEALVAWRCRVLGLPFGDQGLLIRRDFYRALGGFRPEPLMEDVDLIRRIGRKRLAMLDCPATTSAARYAREGYVLRPTRNLLCLALYFLGLPSRWLARLYG